MSHDPSDAWAAGCAAVILSCLSAIAAAGLALIVCVVAQPPTIAYFFAPLGSALLAFAMAFVGCLILEMRDQMERDRKARQ